MPVDKSKYPDNWAEISEHIRFERAGGKCEWCGAPHGKLILRSTKDAEQYLVLEDDGIYYHPDHGAVRLSEQGGEYIDAKHVKVILTTAHLDHDTANNDPSNLAALCQLHHLRHDAKYHARNAARTRRKKHEAETGQMRLWSGNG